MPKNRAAGFKLEVPLDASGIEDFKPEKTVRVLVRGKQGVQSQEVKLNEKGHGSATFSFAENPGALRLIVGPGDASDDELQGLQTLSMDVSAAQFRDVPEVRLPPVLIPPYHWFWWLRWCRLFVIRGRVVCPDGSPVPGATVCAHDVDWWFWFSSTQTVGCATTDINGAFEIRFRWCCRWWPWWWWRHRRWEFNPLLADRIGSVLKRAPDIRLSPAASNQPGLGPFSELLALEGVPLSKELRPRDVNNLESLRTRLIQKLPASPELKALHIWPWWPWFPWWDCTPDIIFRVTQDCLTPDAVIVNETVFDTRWNIDNPLDVPLVANDLACCRQQCPEPPCEEGECLIVTQVCGDPIDEIGGNTGAPAAPAGYFRPGFVVPGAVDYNGDRPYARVVPVVKNFGAMLNVDYYEIEHFSGGAWGPLPAGAAVDFKRRWMEMVAGFPTGDVPFNFVNIAGHNVVMSKERFEATGGLGGWGVNRFWLVNEFLVVPLDTSKFGDGLHEFRVVGWNDGGGGTLVNQRVLPLCGTQTDNSLMLTFDNRTITSPALHDPTHNCGGVHICTMEPDTHISAVRINGVPVGACGTVDAAAGNLEVDFEVTDPDGHLAVYSLIATYGLNQSVNLLNRPGSAVVALAVGTQSGWAAVPVAAKANGTYGIALLQGAVAPHWYGGSYRLTVPASEAFPEPCCYQLELRGWKRTVVGGQSGIVFLCEHDYAHANLTEFTVGVGVCPPKGKVIPAAVEIARET